MFRSRSTLIFVYLIKSELSVPTNTYPQFPKLKVRNLENEEPKE